MSDATEMLDLLWGEGVHSICYQRKPSPFNVLGFANDRDELLSQSMRLSSQGCDTWWGVNALPSAPSTGRGRSEDVVAVVCLYADIDWDDEAHKGVGLPSKGEVIERLADFDVQPNVTVMSGHGYQCYWSLTEPVAAPVGLEMQRNLHALLEHQALLRPERFDLASVLRLPGTINYKREPIEVTLTSFEPDDGFEPVPLAAFLTPLTPILPVDRGIAVPILRPQDAIDNEQTPLEWFVENADMRAEMVSRGWQFHSHATFEGYQTEFWTRPGKPITDGHSARLFASEVLKNWSGNAYPIVEGGRYDVAEFVAAYEHGGSKAALASDLRRYSMPRNVTETAPGAPQAPETAILPPQAPSTWPRLPERLWAERAEFSHIGLAADARTVSREAALMGVVALVLLHVPNAIHLGERPRIGACNLYACFAGRPGTGKGSAIDLAQELLPSPHATVHTTLGTAEGFIKAFHHRDPDYEGKGQAPLVRHWNPVLVRTDEIGAFAASAGATSERGASLLAELKQAWSGERLGKGYAGEDKGMQIAAHTYRVGALMGIAPAKAAPLFGDAGGGFPERLLFAPAAVAYLPEDESTLPSFPGALPWRSPWAGFRNEVGAGFRIEPEVTRAVHLINRPHRLGDLDADPLDVHMALARLKIAAALAMLNARVRIEWRDWELAETLLDLSQDTRRALLATIEFEQQRRSATSRAEFTARNVEARKATLEVERHHEHAQHTETVRTSAVRIHTVLAGRDGMKRKDVRNSLSAKQRLVFEEALDYAKAAGWAIEVEEAGHGTPMRLLRAGPNGPNQG